MGAKISFEIYLLSWITDQIVYPILLEKIGDANHLLPYYFIIVPFNFVVTGVLAFGVYYLSNSIEKIVLKRKKDK